MRRKTVCESRTVSDGSKGIYGVSEVCHLVSLGCSVLHFITL